MAKERRDKMDTTDIYVIITSWDDVLYKLEAWSKNYYLASVYYRQFKKKHPDAMLKIYSSSGNMKMMQLARDLKRDYDTTVEDIIDLELKLAASKDNNLCVIYKAKYHNSFVTESIDIDPGIYKDFTNVLTRTFLSPAILTKYIHTSPNLFELLFRSYNYASSDQNLVDIDMVYLWFFFLKVSQINFITDFHRDVVPIDSVFVRVDEY